MKNNASGTITSGRKNGATTLSERVDVSRCNFFFDFDNTITEFDVLDDIIQRFSQDNSWMKLEEDWESGKIGSKECLEGQLSLVRAKKEKLLQYLATIKIDPAFPKLVAFLREEGVEPVILSDSFSFLIENILRNHQIHDIKIYCNHLKFSAGKLILTFPHRNKECLSCAHCKKKMLLSNLGKDKISVYVGDGLSDVCPAMSADIVFAKGSLLERLRRSGQECIAIQGLGDVYSFFKEMAP